MPPSEGEHAPDFEALLCDGETFRPRRLADVLDGGCVVVFYGFSFSAIAENWWKRYDRAGWDDFDVPVVGVSRDGPYAQNAFLRDLDSPFRLFSDVEGTAADAYDLLTERDGMDSTRTARRSVFVLDAERQVVDRWLADDWISPVPREKIEAAIAERTR
ncbi:peroxiredoxin family protein [Halococcus saccharolyticus]|uniref:Peroxiredoxin-like protein n=1 Tax=Halococcus saccharolyticus DSM 5350 TaxID=1227455 RepID=M0MKY8_9EURY|nr:peroxiredoxin family protein [Halococcus saccharolyticus]EMA45404.1 peroxiredoxin-like protein [Halococcus saccharolyticus DSM 5350]